MHEGVISVIIPVFQAAKSIRKCVESVLDQTYDRLQIILVDDGSTDGSGNICDEYTLVDSRVEVIHTQNCGSVLSRKEGLKRAHGEYVGFVDADDYIKKDFFLNLYNAIEASDTDLVHSWFLSDYQGKVVCEYNPYNDEFVVKNDEDREIVIRKFFIDDETKLTASMWSKIYNTEFIRDCFSFLPEKQCFGEDYLLLFCCLVKCKSLKIIDTCEYIYKVQDCSLSHCEDEALFQKKIVLLNEVMDLNSRLGSPLSYRELNFWLRKEVGSALQSTNKCLRKIGAIRYHIENVDRYRGKKVIIYGAGNIGKDYLNQFYEYGLDKPVAIVDKVKRKLFWDEIEISKPSSVLDMEYDLIIIAVYKESLANIIRDELKSMGVPEIKMIWEKPYR